MDPVGAPRRSWPPSWASLVSSLTAAGSTSPSAREWGAEAGSRLHSPRPSLSLSPWPGLDLSVSASHLFDFCLRFRFGPCDRFSHADSNPSDRFFFLILKTKLNPCDRFYVLRVPVYNVQFNKSLTGTILYKKSVGGNFLGILG